MKGLVGHIHNQVICSLMILPAEVFNMTVLYF